MKEKIVLRLATRKKDKTAGRNFISTISDLYTMGFSEFQIRKIRESSNKMTVEPLAAFSMEERESNLFPKVWMATSIVLFFGFRSPIFNIVRFSQSFWML